MQKVNRAGRAYGKLRVLREAGHIGKQIAWVCRCECGKETRISGSNLTTGVAVV